MKIRKRHIYLLMLFLFSILNLKSQTNEIDSLKKLILTQNTEQNIQTYCQISKAFYNINSDSAHFYADLSIELLEKTKKNEYYQIAYNRKGLAFFGEFDFNNAMIFYRKSIQWGKKYNKLEELGNSYNSIGAIYQMQTQYDSALIVFKTALEYYIKTDNPERIGRVYDNMGIVYYLKGNFNYSLDYFLKAKDYFLKTNDKKSLASTYYKIANIYNEKENYIEAEKNALKSYELLKESNEYIEIVKSLISLGIIYKNQEKFQEAFGCYFQGLKLIENKNIPYVEATLYGNLGSLYFVTNDYINSKEYHLKALKISRENNLRNLIASSLNNLAEVEEILENYSTAEKYLLESLSIYEDLKETSNIIILYEHIYKLYKKQNKLSYSLDYLEKYVEFNDSINKVNKNKSLDSLLTIFKTKELETENIILTQESEINNKTIENQRIYILSAILIILLIIILTLSIIKNKNRIKAAFVIVKEKNEEITEQSEELKNMNEKLLELDNFKSSIMQMIVHDLKNPLNNLINIDVFKTESEKFSVVKNTSNLIMNMVLNILDIQKYEDSKLNLTYEDVSAFGIIDNVHKDTLFLMDEKNLTLKKNIIDDVVLLCDKNIIIRVFTNLLSNAIKYSPLNSEIIIETANSENDKMITFKIIDLGEGIPEEYLDKIFDKFVQIDAKKDKVRSTGLGLTFCKMAVESHGGKIKAINNHKNGAVFMFDLPKSDKIIKYKQNNELEKINSIIFLQSEKEYLSLYYAELEQTPIYKISVINNILVKIRTNIKSENINLWCDNIYKSALNGNNLEFNNYLSIIK